MFDRFGLGFFIRFVRPCIGRTIGAGPLWAGLTLGYHVFVLATRSPDLDAARPLPYGTVPVLLLLTFALDLAAVLIRGRLRARLLGRT